MADAKEITDYYEYIQAVFTYATKCWTAGEGEFTVKVGSNNRKVQGKIEGGETWRSDKKGQKLIL